MRLRLIDQSRTFCQSQSTNQQIQSTKNRPKYRKVHFEMHLEDIGKGTSETSLHGSQKGSEGGGGVCAKEGTHDPHREHFQKIC